MRRRRSEIVHRGQATRQAGVRAFSDRQLPYLPAGTEARMAGAARGPASRGAREVTASRPAGLSFVGHPPKGITLAEATLKSLRLSHGRLTITLRDPVRSLTITIASTALTETPRSKPKPKPSPT